MASRSHHLRVLGRCLSRHGQVFCSTQQTARATQVRLIGANAVATTSQAYSKSRVTPHAPSSRPQLLFASHRSSNAFSTLLPPTTHALTVSSIARFDARGMVTMTRQPEHPEDPDVFLNDEAPELILTDRAIAQLRKVSEKERNPSLALRIAVEPGGCHGYQYKMELTNEVEDDDFRFSVGENVHLLVDSTSLRLIKGSTIDYVTELIGSQFAIFNNPQAKGAGCGCGVSWEPNI